ncbi:amastin-like surface protein-like protein-related [Anaeramoeba ignava]|uniref:Amastin-like surface protein-like protein-related n=1 Tax=Anaeramoeba ignava TaxID=1746090 RepID=A0A9Q0LKC1_ANAIG|nr:amastin-like surface protein-like protein-related [Anaeramoeba ignava]
MEMDWLKFYKRFSFILLILAMLFVGISIGEPNLLKLSCSNGLYFNGRSDITIGNFIGTTNPNQVYCDPHYISICYYKKNDKFLFAGMIVNILFSLLGIIFSANSLFEYRHSSKLSILLGFCGWLFIFLGLVIFAACWNSSSTYNRTQDHSAGCSLKYGVAFQLQLSALILSFFSLLIHSLVFRKQEQKVTIEYTESDYGKDSDILLN